MTAPTFTTQTTCRTHLERTDSPCTQPAAYRITAGCVHEHIWTGELCAECILRFRRGDGICGACQDAGHECVIAGREVPIGGEPA
jgi:hypothetical protein